jgi:hypothetical protein
MVSAYDVGVRLLKYTWYTFFTYILGFAVLFLLNSFNLMPLGALAGFLVIVMVFNLVLFLHSHRNLDAFDNDRLEFACAFLPVLLTPLGSYIFGGILMTVVGPPLKKRRGIH